MKNRKNHLINFGFSFKKGGVHSARSMMIEDLRLLLSYIKNQDAIKKDYLQAIEEDNCLGKRSGKTRMLSGRHLVDLYSLDPSITIFKALLYFWKRDPNGQPLLALLCAYARDPILRMSAPFILKFQEGSNITRESLEEYIDNQDPGRFSKATLKSTAQNLNGSWTRSGHLIGKAKKTRSKANPTVGSVAYALFFGYLSGERGQSLFQSEYAYVLDCSTDRMIELAEEASRRGWIVFKRVGTVMEVQFPNLLNAQEKEWVHEQN